MRRVLLITLALFCAMAPSAAQATVITKPSSFNLAVGQPVKVRVVVPAGQKLPPTGACFNFEFGANALDYGETVWVDPAPGSGLGMYGYSNWGIDPITNRPICINSIYQPEMMQLFADGHQTIQVSIENGSARVNKFTVSFN